MRRAGSSRTASASRRHEGAHLGVVPRSGGMSASRSRSRAFELWVAAAVLANNLMRLQPCWRTDHRADEKPPDSPDPSLVERDRRSSLRPRAVNGEFVKSRQKIESEHLAKPTSIVVVPNLLGNLRMPA